MSMPRNSGGSIWRRAVSSLANQARQAASRRRSISGSIAPPDVTCEAFRAVAGSGSGVAKSDGVAVTASTAAISVDFRMDPIGVLP